MAESNSTRSNNPAADQEDPWRVFIMRHVNGDFWKYTQADDRANEVHPRFVCYQSPSDYMRPILEPGDLAEIDMLDVRVCEGLFMLRLSEGDLLLRRLHPLLNGRVRVSTDAAPREVDHA